MPICPEGHHTAERDYCDVCGTPIDMSAQPTSVAPVQVASPSPERDKNCPNCGAMNPEDALFCEACGYDYTTGAKPRTREEAAAMLNLDTPVPTPAPAPEPLTLEVDGAPEPTVSPLAEQDDPVLVVPSDDQPEAQEAAPTMAAEDEPIVDEPAGDEPAEESSVVAEPVTPTPSEEPVPAPLILPTATELPADVAPADDTFTHVAEVWVDPVWYAEQQASDPMPSAGLPLIYPLRGRTQLVGRTSKSKGVSPDVDCGVDAGCSRRQSQITTDGRRFWVEDLDSANGTYVAPSSGPLPHAPITTKVEVGSTDRIYVGGWTRIVIRPATPDELTELKDA